MVHYEKRYAKVFTIMKLWTLKHKPFFYVGGGGSLFVVLYGICINDDTQYTVRKLDSLCIAQ